MQRFHAVEKRVRKLPLDEQPINAIVVQAMAKGLQFVIMDDAHQWMEQRSTDKLGIVGRGVNFQNLLHFDCKDTENSLIMVFYIPQSHEAALRRGFIEQTE